MAVRNSTKGIRALLIHCRRRDCVALTQIPKCRKAENIHEYFVWKYKFQPAEAIYVSTMVHTTAQVFGKIMALTEPRRAVAYHFQNDFDTAPVMEAAIRTTYDGPLDLATDFMVWNVTKDGTRTRMAIPNHERYPEPAQRETIPSDMENAYTWDPINFEGIERETAAVINEVLEAFNARFGTDVKPSLSGIPFKDKD